jgi:hypothetical protein
MPCSSTQFPIGVSPFVATQTYDAAIRCYCWKGLGLPSLTAEERAIFAFPKSLGWQHILSWNLLTGVKFEQISFVVKSFDCRMVDPTTSTRLQ